jgi:hypothetical protein
MTYDRGSGVAYAHRWAYGRNPRYHDFDGTGGDCTNFVSQCLFAACGVMNYALGGWYYRSLNDRSPAWSGVPFLHDFLTKNADNISGSGPYGHEAPIEEARSGDIVQLSFDGQTFQHSLYIIETGWPASPGNILIAAHTFNADYRPLDSYLYEKERLIVIDGVRP